MVEPLQKDLPALTSLRFLAAIWVMGFHYLEYLPAEHGLQRSLFRQGVVAVDFFFILSGFILMHAYAAQVQAGRFRYADFLVKRFARIYPAHVVMLAVFVTFAFLATRLGLELQNPDRYRSSAIVPNVLMIHAWGGSSGFSFNYPSWSISAEWMAYLLFPAVAATGLGLERAFGSLPRPELWTLAVVLALLLGVWGAVWTVWGQPVSAFTTQHVALRILPEFLLGACLYLVARAGGRCGAWAVALVAMAVLALAQAQAPHIVLVLSCAALILMAALASRGGGGGLLDTPLFVYLGEISYSVYMVHVFLAALLFKATALFPGAIDPVIVFVGGMLATTVFAGVFHHLIEGPARRAILALWSRRTPSALSPSVPEKGR